MSLQVQVKFMLLLRQKKRFQETPLFNRSIPKKVGKDSVVPGSVLMENDFVQDSAPQRHNSVNSDKITSSPVDKSTTKQCTKSKGGLVKRITVTSSKSIQDYKDMAKTCPFFIMNNEELNHSSDSFEIDCNGTTCSLQRKHFHCLLCNEESFVKPSLLKWHVKQVHLNPKHYVEMDPIICLPCRKREHSSSKNAGKLSHYHCPICDICVLQKHNFQCHLSLHKNTRSSFFNTNPCNGLPCNDKNEDHVPVHSPSVENIFSDTNAKEASCKNLEQNPDNIARSTSDSDEEKLNVPFNDTIQEDFLPSNTKRTLCVERKTCDLCGKLMRADSIGRHMKNIHAIDERISAVCVDREHAIFMVPKSKSGVGYPIHVKKLLHGTENKELFCESQKCMDMMAVCTHSGMKDV